MIKVIINADDCGISSEVDNRIEDAINNRVITSTTIMANMEDFEGAKKLYQKYSDQVSFGAHLNLTEGNPMIDSQLLLEKGIYLEKDGKVVFNASPFRRKLLGREERKAIYNELQCQMEKIIDSGVKISHIDSHHFIHQAIFMLPILPKLCKEFGITKVRNYSNYLGASINHALRNCWLPIIKLQDRQITSTEWFTSFTCFWDNLCNGREYCKEGQRIELMTHPGGIYKEEDEKLFSIDWKNYKKYQLINYNDL